MTLLTQIQAAANRLGIPQPSTVIGNTDQNVVQLLALANEEGEELASRHRWQRLVKEKTFTTIAAALQTGILPTDFDYILTDTFWDRSNDQPVYALSAEDWQERQAASVVGPYVKFRIFQNDIYLSPTPAAGKSMAFEYVSRNWCQTSAGSGLTAWATDTNTGVIDERLMAYGVIWRFKKAKGLDYAEDFRGYESRVVNAIARDGSPPIISFGQGRFSRRFIDNRNIADGSWS